MWYQILVTMDDEYMRIQMRVQMAKMALTTALYDGVITSQNFRTEVSSVVDKVLEEERRKNEKSD